MFNWSLRSEYKKGAGLSVTVPWHDQAPKDQSNASPRAL
ncbi:hypothetical protein QFZ48_002876 [Chitinophaga sp. W2I13]